jgi:hypothetical protein
MDLFACILLFRVHVISCAALDTTLAAALAVVPAQLGGGTTLAKHWLVKGEGPKIT